MDCVVLAYTASHRKTYDTLCRLKSLGYNNVVVRAGPMHYKKKLAPLYERRPPVFEDISTKVQCKAFGYEYMESVNGYNGLPGDADTLGLVCGAGLYQRV